MPMFISFIFWCRYLGAEGLYIFEFLQGQMEKLDVSQLNSERERDVENLDVYPLRWIGTIPWRAHFHRSQGI